MIPGARTPGTEVLMRTLLPRIAAGLLAAFAFLLVPTRAQALTVTAYGRTVPTAANSTEAVRIKPGDQVTFLGTGLDTVGEARFGTGSAAILQRLSGKLVVLVPPDATTGPASLYDRFGLAWSSFVDFELAPLVTKFARSVPEPATPADAIRGVPGNSVRITGANFIAVNDPSFTTAVYFPAAGGGWVAATVEFASQTTVQVTIPLQAVSGNLLVANPSGFVTTAGRFYLPPLVTGFNPTAAHVDDTVTLSGHSLLDVTSVTLGGKPATIVSGDATNVVIRVPALSDSAAVTVTTPGGSYLTATSLVLLPKVDGFTPAGGGPGTVVTLTGSGLLGTSKVMFGNTPGNQVTVVDSKTVTAVVPSSAFTGPITVTTPNGTAASAANFFAAPSIGDFTPQRARPGDLVTLTGPNLGDATRVEFAAGQVAAFSRQATNRITALVPDGAVTGPVKVTTPGGTATSALTFQVVGILPVVYDFTPRYGAPGTVVKVSGDNLSSPTSVLFNGKPATSFVAVGGTNVTVTVPDGASSGPISVVTAAGTAVSAQSFLVGNSADLAVSAQADTPSPVVGGAAVLTFTLRNLGPLPAENVSLGIALPSGVQVVEATSTSGTVDQLGLGLSVQPGTMPSGGQVTVTVRVKATGAGPQAFQAEAASDTPDLQPGNNAVGLTLTPQRPAITATRGVGTLTLSWPGSGFVPQGAPTPTGTWQDLAETPSSNGTTTSVNVPVDAAARFYRLRQGP